MSDVDFKIGASSVDAENKLDRVANKAMTTGQKMQSAMRESSYKMAASMRDATDKIDSEFGRMGKLAETVKSKFLLVTAALSAGMGASGIIKTASEFEQLEIRLRSVMGSAAAGEEAFTWIKQFGVETPLSVKEVTDAFMTLKNFGLDPMDGSLRKIADASGKYGKDAQALQSITLALGQAWGLGKLQGNDLMQMVNAGLPVWDLLSTATGKSSAELRKMSENGELGREVIRKLIDEMGRVSEGALADLMRTLAGAFSNMGDAIDSTVDKMRKAGGFVWMTEGIQALTELIPPLGDLFQQVMGSIADVLKTVWAVFSETFGAIYQVVLSVFGANGEPVGAIETFKRILQGLSLTIVGFRALFQAALSNIKLVVMETAQALITFSTVAGKALFLDFEGAKAAWNTGTAAMKSTHKKYNDELEAIHKTGNERIKSIIGAGAAKVADHPVAPIENVNSTSLNKKGAGASKAKEVNRVSDWDAELTAMRDGFEKQKLEQGSFEEFGKARERDYWKNILDTVKLSTAEKAGVSGKYYALERDLRKSAFDAELAEMKNQLNAAQEGGTQRIAIAEDIAKKVGEKYGLESKEYKAAQNEIVQMANAHQQQMEQLAQLALARHQANQQNLLDLERVSIEESAALGEISQMQKLQKLAGIKEQEFQIELQAAIDRAALVENDVVAYQQAMDRILDIKRKHEVDKANITKEINMANKDQFDQMFSPFQTAFEKSINAMIAGTQTFQGAMRNMALSVLGEFSNMGVRMFVQWVSNQARMTAATATGTAARTGIEAAGASKSMAISGATSFKSIMNSAFEAMAGAYKAIAGIPIVGPVLAPVVAAGAFAGVAGIAGRVMSARGGYDIPAGLNPMTQLHEKEMVLPAKHADTIRELSDQGSSGAAAVHIHGSDNSTIKIGDLKKALRQMGRDFVQVNAT
jgi:tape measure domain-containing protein